ncbi:TPA: ribosomal RNA small subunit methyltransferase A [Candidatus Bathyarchaeota archaeon]|nr:ribosomal RNA small subunit methyltransferase A [Candidatus Bathyarchaeota archaeon]
MKGLKIGLKLRKRLGQHLLVNEGVLARLVEYAEIGSNDTILEAGAGLGNLTSLIAKRAGKVIAVEKDRRMAEILKRKFAGSNVEVIEGDILKIKLPRFNKILANIPYYISSKFIILILNWNFDLAVLTLQKEFAERLVAEPGTKEYGRLTVAVGRKMEVEILEIISRNAFFPRPKVDSTVVRLKPKLDAANVDEMLFEEITRGLFNQRRRKLQTVLLNFLVKKYGGVGKDIFASMDVPNKRVHETSIQEFERLATQISALISTRLREKNVI